MKRFIPVLLTLILLFSSCGGKVHTLEAIPTDLMAELVELYPDIPPSKQVYFEGAEEYGKGYLEWEYACYMYMDDYDESFKSFDLLDSYAIRIPDGKSVFEIHIFKVRNLSDVPEIEKMCQKRIDILKSGSIAEYDPQFDEIIQNSETYTVGNYVFLLSTTDNEAAKNLINKY